jgi:hypothetical protein
MREFIYPGNVVWILEDTTECVIAVDDVGQPTLLTFTDEYLAQGYAEDAGLTGKRPRALRGVPEFLHFLNWVRTMNVHRIAIDPSIGRGMFCDDIGPLVNKMTAGGKEKP